MCCRPYLSCYKAAALTASISTCRKPHTDSDCCKSAGFYSIPLVEVLVMVVEVVAVEVMVVRT